MIGSIPVTVEFARTGRAFCFLIGMDHFFSQVLESLDDSASVRLAQVSSVFAEAFHSHRFWRKQAANRGLEVWVKGDNARC